MSLLEFIFTDIIGPLCLVYCLWVCLKEGGRWI